MSWSKIPRWCMKDNCTGTISLRRQWANWIVVVSIQLLLTACFWVMTPSLHQFTTNPKVQDGGNSKYHGTKLWPGLDLSEYTYSWIVTAFSLGEVVGGLVGGLLATLLPYFVTFLLVCCINMIGGLFYAFTINAYMIFIGRFMLGFFLGSGSVLMNGYIGESVERFKKAKGAEKEKQTEKKSKAPSIKSNPNRTLKDFLFIIVGLVRTLGYLTANDLNALVSHFPDVEPFRWPGWFSFTSTAVYAILFIIIFKEPTRCSLQKEDKLDDTKELVETEKMAAPINKYKKWSCWSLTKSILAYTMLVILGYEAGSLFTITDTLINPILGDHFGFTVGDTSVFLVAGMVFVITSSIILAILKLLAVDNRIIMMMILGSAATGGIVMSDWQSIGTDPCESFCQHVNDTILVNDIPLNNYSTTLPPFVTNDSDVNSCEVTVELLKRGIYTNESIANTERQCTEASTQQHKCFWNPRNQITGRYCIDCLPRCNSKRKSLTFAQLAIGMSLIMLAYPAGNTIVFVIGSDYTPTAYQGTIMGAMFTAAGLSRVLSPPWSDAVYEAYDKRTYAVMSIKSALWGTTFLLLIILYKIIAPKSRRAKKHSNGDNDTEHTVDNKLDSRESAGELLLSQSGGITSDSDAY